MKAWIFAKKWLKSSVLFNISNKNYIKLKEIVRSSHLDWKEGRVEMF